jgi:hypothetical protein
VREAPGADVELDKVSSPDLADGHSEALRSSVEDTITDAAIFGSDIDEQLKPFGIPSSAGRQGQIRRLRRDARVT